MRTTESSPGNEGGARERDRALERTLRDALALAVSKRVADQVLRRTRKKTHSADRPSPCCRPPGRLRHVAGLHLALVADPETVRRINPKAAPVAPVIA